MHLRTRRTFQAFKICSLSISKQVVDQNPYANRSIRFTGEGLMSTDEARIRSEKLSRALSQVNEMHKILGSDLNHAIDFARRYPSQFADRTLIRTYAALIEGTSYQLRSCVLEFAADYPGTFSTHEIMVLAERKHSLNQWGEVELVKDNYRSTLPLLLLTIRCYGRLCAVDFHPKVKEGNHPTQGWQSTRAFLHCATSLLIQRILNR